MGGYGDLEAILSDPYSTLLLGYALGAVTGAIGWLLARHRIARWNHRQAVLAAIGEPLESERASTYDGHNVNVPEIRWSQSDPRSTELRRHLENPRYKDVLDKLDLATQARNRAAEQISRTMERLEKAIPDDMGDQLGLQEWDGRTGTRNYWDPKSVRKALFDDARQVSEGVSFPKPELDSSPNYDLSPSEKAFTLVINHHKVAEGTEAQMIGLRTELERLLRSEPVIEAAKAFSEAESARLKDSSKANFEQVRTKVHDSLSYGQKELKGQCNLCPPYFGIEVQPGARS